MCHGKLCGRINCVSIQETSQKLKSVVLNDAIFMALILISVGVISFGLGRNSVHPGPLESAKKQNAAAVTESRVPAAAPEKVNIVAPAVGSGATSATETAHTYVGSRTGKKYHLPWCPGAKQMKEENKVWFATKDEAEKAGYTPASNCKGI